MLTELASLIKTDKNLQQSLRASSRGLQANGPPGAPALTWRQWQNIDLHMFQDLRNQQLSKEEFIEALRETQRFPIEDLEYWYEWIVEVYKVTEKPPRTQTKTTPTAQTPISESSLVAKYELALEKQRHTLYAQTMTLKLELQQARFEKQLAEQSNDFYKRSLHQHHQPPPPSPKVEPSLLDVNPKPEPEVSLSKPPTPESL